MQEDMHYYGTYAMARAAGLTAPQAGTVAMAAQYVDDSTANDSEIHSDGGMMRTVATAHTNSQAIGNAADNHVEQRQVWVPFHFFPGNQGGTLSERLQCAKDGLLAREMVQNHIRHAVAAKDEYGLQLMGVTAHVYADTFSHYGFSGVSSRNNAVDSESFEFDVKNPEMLAYINDKYGRFLEKYGSSFLIANWRKLVSDGAEAVVASLGHGGVGTYPDRPFLKWKFTYEQSGKPSGWRMNPDTFLEACGKLHEAFSDFAGQAGLARNPVGFDSISEKVRGIIEQEAPMQGRIEAWKAAIRGGELFKPVADEALSYSADVWEQQKAGFNNLPSSADASRLDVYKFHQAAIYHRDHTLKQLLPRHGIVVL